MNILQLVRIKGFEGKEEVPLFERGQVKITLKGIDFKSLEFAEFEDGTCRLIWSLIDKNGKTIKDRE